MRLRFAIAALLFLVLTACGGGGGGGGGWGGGGSAVLGFDVDLAGNLRALPQPTMGALEAV